MGSYAGRHHLESLVVDGEPDQEQYDGRQDVFAVSLAGALMPLSTLQTTGGTDPWFGSFTEADDLCRRICLGGGRVVVVPTAEVAHRRARFEGIRTHEGEPVAQEDAYDTAMGVLEAQQRYYYTDIRTVWWPFLWIWRLLRSVVMAVVRLSRKQPYAALCELALPWRALGTLPAAVRARKRVVRQGTVPLARLSVLSATRQQIGQWRDRSQAFSDQRDTVVLNPLAREHLLRRSVCRWTAVLLAAIVTFAVVAGTHWTVLRAAFGGAAVVSDAWVPTDATFSQLVEAATSSCGRAAPAPHGRTRAAHAVAAGADGGFGVHAGPCGKAGHGAAAVAAAHVERAVALGPRPACSPRSDTVCEAPRRRCCGSLCSLGLGLYDSANLPMLTVMVFLPAAFAFAFRAVGMYRTEDPVRPHKSVQAAAASALCFIPVVAAEPQLRTLPLAVTFLVLLRLRASASRHIAADPVARRSGAGSDAGQRGPSLRRRGMASAVRRRHRTGCGDRRGAGGVVPDRR
ncbi:MAG: glycosyltransferase family 2 protein [Bifidobacterium pullorum]